MEDRHQAVSHLKLTEEVCKQGGEVDKVEEKVALLGSGGDTGCSSGGSRLSVRGRPSTVKQALQGLPSPGERWI